jgi:hypothetical protein
MRFLNFIKTAAGTLILLVFVANVQAADPTGTWKWKFSGQNGREIESTLTLKVEGEKLTGTLARGAAGRTTDITNGTFKNDEVAFETSVERNGNTITQKYKGKIEGDTLKGTIEGGRGGQGRTRDWEAKREKT